MSMRTPPRLRTDKRIAEIAMETTSAQVSNVTVYDRAIDDKVNGSKPMKRIS
jgi:hypothetical protein